MMSYGLEDFEFDDDIGSLRTDPAFNESLVFYPMPDDISHYKLHRYWNNWKLLPWVKINKQFNWE